jgi:RNase P subunit RPR2
MPFFAEPKTIYFCRQCENVAPTNRCPHCDPGTFPTPEELADEQGQAGRDMAEIELPSLSRAVVRISCPHCGDHAFSGANTAWHTKIYSTPAPAVFHCRQCERFYRYSPIPPQTSNLRIGEQ